MSSGANMALSTARPWIGTTSSAPAALTVAEASRTSGVRTDMRAASLTATPGATGFGGPCGSPRTANTHTSTWGLNLRSRHRAAAPRRRERRGRESRVGQPSTARTCGTPPLVRHPSPRSDACATGRSPCHAADPTPRRRRIPRLSQGSHVCPHWSLTPFGGRPLTLLRAFRMGAECAGVSRLQLTHLRPSPRLAPGPRCCPRSLPLGRKLRRGHRFSQSHRVEQVSRQQPLDLSGHLVVRDRHSDAHSTGAAQRDLDR